MSSRAEGAARSRGICRALQTDFSASLREILFPLLVPGGPETASTALTSATFPCQVDFQTDHLAHFSSSLASGGHENSPTSHGLPNFVHNQNPTLRRFLKCLTIRKDVLPVPHVVPYAIPSEARAASIVIPSGGRSPKPRDLQGTPDRFLRSLRSVEMTINGRPAVAADKIPWRSTSPKGCSRQLLRKPSSGAQTKSVPFLRRTRPQPQEGRGRP